MLNSYLILGLSFVLLLLVTYSALVVSNKQTTRAREYYKMQAKSEPNDVLN